MRMSSMFGFALRMFMLNVAVGWFVLLLVQSTKKWEKPKQTLASHTGSSYYGDVGATYIQYGVPVFVVAIVGCIYLHITRNLATTKPKFRRKAWSILRYPVIIGGPLGTLNVGDLTVLLAGLFFLVWSIVNYVLVDIGYVKNYKDSTYKQWQLRMAVVAERSGTIGCLCLIFLFFPVTRGSVFFQLVNIPFETCVKYHIWIGNVIMTLFTLHGVSYMILWHSEGILAKELFSWDKVGFSYMAGFSALISGLIMWITSFKPIREKLFEVFYYAHQSYIPFVVFFGFHTGDKIFSIALPGFFLFFLDRYLRFLQSRKTVDIISVTKFPCSMVQLVASKHPCLDYTPTSVVFLQIPAVSKLEWHPFSIVSSSCVDSDRVSLLIKCKKSWTKKVENLVEAMVSSEISTRLAASIEGPYGPSCNEFLGYEKLILVGGGSGIAPLLSILSETFYHLTAKQGETIATNEITLIWAVRSTEELEVLSVVCPGAICSSFGSTMKLDIQAYVTTSNPSDTEMAAYQDISHLKGNMRFKEFMTGNAFSNSVSSITTPENIIWQAAIVFCSVGIFFLFMALLNHLYIFPKDHNTYKVYPNHGRMLIYYLSMIIGIVIFGGLMFVIWNKKVGSKLDPRSRSPDHSKSSEGAENDEENQVDSLLSIATIHKGKRPNIQGLIAALTKRMGGSNVGVVVCGPQKLEEDVAQSCKQHGCLSSLLGTCPSDSAPANLNFHSLSFDF